MLALSGEWRKIPIQFGENYQVNIPSKDIETQFIILQYTLANPNRGVPIQKISFPITEFVRISEVALIIWKVNNTKICDNPLL